MLAVTDTALIPPPTGNADLDALVAKITGALMAVLFVISMVGNIVQKVRASGILTQIQMFRSAIFNTAEAVETTTNGEFEALAKEFFPRATDEQIQSFAKKAHKLVTGRIKALNKGAGTEEIMHPIVAEVKAKVEEIKKSKVEIKSPQEDGK